LGFSEAKKNVALSRCEAEYIATSTTSYHAVWLSRLLGEVIGEAPKKIQLFVDNKSTITLCKNHVHHDMSKHTDTRYHFIKVCIE
jgi:hypothetical protein